MTGKQLDKAAGKFTWDVSVSVVSALVLGVLFAAWHTLSKRY